MIRKRELTIAIAHKAALRLRGIDQGINNGINWSCIYLVYSSGAGSCFPLVRDKPSVDPIDLVKLEHGRVLIENAWLW